MTSNPIPNPLNQFQQGEENQSGQLENQSQMESQNTGTTSPTEFEILQRQVAQMQQMMGTIANSLQQNQQPVQQVPQRQQYQINPDDWQDPTKAPNLIADIIHRETQQAVAPLMEFRKQYERTNMYQSIKNQVKNSNPMFAKLWAHIEPYLDQTFSAGNVDVNPNIVAYQAQAVIGNLMMTQPHLLNQAPAGNPNAPNMISPSGAPTRQGNQETPKLRELDDNEETLRKARGLTKEQYLQLQAGGSMLLTPASERGKK